MTRPLRSYVCESCGVAILRPSRTDRPKLCQECAIGRVARNAYRRSTFGVSRRLVLSRQAPQ